MESLFKNNKEKNKNNNFDLKYLLKIIRNSI